MARRRSKKRGNGEGTVYPRADGTWCGQITVSTDYITGKVKRKTFYAATQGEVVDKMMNFRATNPLVATGSQMRLKEACDFWLAGQQSRVSDSSMTNYWHALGHVQTYLGDVRLGELSALGVQQGLDRMAAAGLSVSRLSAHKSRRWHAIFRGPCHLGSPPEGLVFTAQKGGLIHHRPWYYGHWMPLLIRAGLTRPGVHGPEAPSPRSRALSGQSAWPRPARLGSSRPRRPSRHRRPIRQCPAIASDASLAPLAQDARSSYKHPP
jgi:hypothetical protein